MTGVLVSSWPKRRGNDVQDGTARDRCQDSLVACARMWIECNLTHDQDNLDDTGAATVSCSLQLTTASEVRTTMCEDEKLARFWRRLECSGDWFVE